MKSDAVTDFAERVAATYGSRPRHHGRELRTFCPVHEAAGEDHNPSLAIWDRGGGLPAYKCMTGCDKAAVKAALKARGISVGNGPVSVEAQIIARKTKQQRKDDAVTKAFELVKNSAQIDLRTPAYDYLESRGLLLNGLLQRALRASDDPLFPGGQALLGIIVDLTTMRSETPKAKGVQTLSLTSAGNARAKDGKKLRSILGEQKGYGVPLGDPHANTLLVAEGLETTLAAMQMLPLPVLGVATLSASNMPFLLVPEWIERVIIAADNDEPGLKAAHALKRDMDAARMPCAITTWGEAGSGWDACDELKRSNG